jgi:hypothetical protein
MNSIWIAIAYLFVGATVGVVAMSLAVMGKGEEATALSERERRSRKLN